MLREHRFVLILAVSGLAAWLAPVAHAQEAGKKYRRLAPGVERTIPVERSETETVSTHDVVELRATPDLKWSPVFTPESRTLYEMAADVKFRRPIKGLDFTFKPLRMIYVDVPQPSGKLQRKLVWYMVYRVTNRGGHLVPNEQEDGTFTTEKVDEEVYFTPQFVLEDTHEHKKAYLDRIIPVALGPIQQREDPNRPLLNTVQMSAKPIPLSTEREDRSVWGVATWLDIDPRLDFFSIYVYGLTNAYRWTDPEGVYKHGDPLGAGRRFQRKVLRLNFWRPGDEFDETEEEIFFGTPHGKAALYGVKEGVDYTWVYR